jgi:hypothetical protein
LQKAGKANYGHVPVTSKLFQKGQEYKGKKVTHTPGPEVDASKPAPAVAVTTVTTPAAPAVAQPTMPMPAINQAQLAQYASIFNPFLFNPLAPYTMGMPAAMGMMGAMGMQGYGTQSSRYPSTSPHRERSSSPVNIPGDIHTFCETYGIGEADEHALERLGFVMGDNLDEVTEQEYKEAGFKPLAWKRVLKAYKKYKRASKA